MGVYSVIPVQFICESDWRKAIHEIYMPVKDQLYGGGSNQSQSV